jgi:RNA polymerase-binding transcription factor DksA
MDAQGSRRQLEAEAERLRKVRDGLEREHPHEPDGELSSLDQHQADAASEMLEREMEQSILALVDADGREVLDALRRLDDGAYGTCEVCRAPISDERLLAVPATRFCLEHEERHEAGGISRYPDGAAFADDIAAREALQHLEFLPTDDEADEDLQLGPEELALHRIGRPDEPYGALTPEELELAEMGAFELDDDRQSESAREALGRRAAADAAALEDEELDRAAGGYR